MSLEAIILWQDAISWWFRGGISEEASLAYHKFSEACEGLLLYFLTQDKGSSSDKYRNLKNRTMFNILPSTSNFVAQQPVMSAH